MKYTLIIVLFAGLLISCGGDKEPAETKAKTKMSSHTAQTTIDGEKLIYYTCPMESHKHIHSKEPGSCSECNMKLVPAVITSADKQEYYGCPMEIHSHIRHDAPGRCEECKMELKPMRLNKSS